MKNFAGWFKEHLQTRKFILSLIASILVGSGLIIEFHCFGYSKLKILRYLILLTGMFFIAWIDGEIHTIPNKFLLRLTLARFIILIMECLMYTPAMAALLIAAVLGSFTGAILFGSCYLLSRGGIGAGDVKLFMVIGFFTGTNVVVATAFLSVCIAAVYSIVLWIAHRIGLKQTIPFGPFVYIGMIIAFAMGV